jgi:hypothetical protein
MPTTYADVTRELGSVTMPRVCLGYLSPFALTDVVPYVFYQGVPPEVMLVVQDMGLRSYEPPAVWVAFEMLDEVIGQFAAKSVDLLVLGGSVLSMSADRVGLRTRLDRIASGVGAPVVTDMDVTVAAMVAEGVERVAVAHRLKGVDDAAVHHYFAEHGIAVAGVVSEPGDPRHNLAGSHAAATEDAHRLGALALRRHLDVDGLVLLGGSWIAQQPAALLGAEFGVPVFNNLSALVWVGRRLVEGGGVDDWSA